MARLPQPGGDDGNWGEILNDFLSQSHNEDGTLKPDVVGSEQIKAESLADKVVKPTSATVNAVPRYADNTGQTLKDSGVGIDDTAMLYASGLRATNSQGSLTVQSGLYPTLRYDNSSGESRAQWINTSSNTGGGSLFDFKSSGTYGFFAIRGGMNDNTRTSLYIDSSFNIGLGAIRTLNVQTGGGSGVINIADAVTPPSSSASNGGLLYAESRALKYRGANGIVSLPDTTDTLVGRATTDTLTNKTISGASNTLSNIPASAVTGLQAVIDNQTRGFIRVYRNGNISVPSATLTSIICNAILTNAGANDLSHDTSSGATTILKTGAYMIQTFIRARTAASTDEVAFAIYINGAPAHSTTLQNGGGDRRGQSASMYALNAGDTLDFRVWCAGTTNTVYGELDRDTGFAVTRLN